MEAIDVRARDEVGELLSVSIHHGVVPRSDLTDDEARADRLNHYKRVSRGDIVINRMRAFQGAVGVSDYEGLVSPEYLVLRPADFAVGRYLHYLFRSHWFVGEMVSRLRGIGSSDQGNVRTPRINAGDLGDIKVPLPPKTAQRAIADFLDIETARINALIAKKRRLIELIGERRMSLMTAGVSGRFTLSGQHNPSSLPWLDSIPEHWGEVGLTLVALLGSGHTPSRRRVDWWIESECTIPWVTTGEVARLRSDRVEYIDESREKISPIGLENSAAEVHPADTVVLCRTASAGYSGIIRSDMATSQDFATWTCGPLLRPRFLLLCLRAMRGDLLGRLAMGSTHKTIYMPDIQSIRIPLPPVEEQDEIVETVWRQLDREGHIVDLLTRHIDLLTERRQALITAAVTGELDVAESTSEQAS